MGASMRQDPFQRHRLALVVSDPQLTADRLQSAIVEIKQFGPQFYTDFLRRQGLSSYWHYVLERHELSNALDRVALTALKEARIQETVSYMTQKVGLQEIDRLFGANDIRYAVIKGGSVREVVYSDPALRPASDIDILVSPEQRFAAVSVMKEAGFSLIVEPANISHEVSLCNDRFCVDLHWDILRPGRTRIPSVSRLLANRCRHGDIWGFDDVGVVFLMLVHPAFAKYICSTNMDLNKVNDFVLWVSKRDIDWDAVADLLEQTGLCSAAWAVLAWFGMLLRPEDLHVPEAFVRRIAPGPMRRRYLTSWLESNLPTRWLERPARIKFGFTLFLHDSPSDALHALMEIRRARSRGQTDPLLDLSA